jgi:hypothetical protein
MGDGSCELVTWDIFISHVSHVNLSYLIIQCDLVMKLAWMGRSDLASALIELVLDLFKPRVRKRVEPRGRTPQEGTYQISTIKAPPRRIAGSSIL